ncbi:protein SOK1 [Echria macrotheca]|uniref:Protein SOK1 n=1 Tax=Echria macrotheca TaxID=438768 RepID=A0AAJ0FHF8_9PEZI|nr:protein SOK1 [Echria macrotheca]
MNDQGAGGGIESHMAAHRRQDSSDEPIPAEATTESRQSAPESNQETKFAESVLAMGGSRVLVGEETAPATPVVEVAPGLSRTSSSCSTSSGPRQPPEDYLAAQVAPVVERRPSPLSRFMVTTSPSRPLEPPVTKHTLSELDVHKIIHNPKLRHDINFDPELHFRPNLDGEKGRRKQEKANQFWTALEEQLTQFVVDRDGFARRYGTNGEWCLPVLLKAVKEIISTLVPQRDREILNEGLNVDLLMQQFHKGVADLEKLASWLSGVLKLHCAPMRDEWVDEMYNELRSGNRSNDMNELVKGMRSLLSVLEAMKLDVANHQIRCLRPVLIDDTVNFEQRFFLKRIQTGRMDIRGATAWYQRAQSSAQCSNGSIPHAEALGDMAVFIEALLTLILPSTSTENFPATFLFDEDRIVKLRSDVYDSICLEICMRKYDDLERVSRLMQSNPFAAGFGGTASARSSRSSVDFNFCAPTSRPASLAFSDRGSVTSSPRNSSYLSNHSSSDLGETTNRSRPQQVYNSLVALLNTATPASRSQQKWQSLAPVMAVQILRFVNNAPALPEFEAHLTKCLTDVQSDIFREVESQFQQRLLAALARRIKEFKKLSGVGLFTVATGGRIHGSGRGWSDRDRDVLLGESGLSRDPREEAGIDDMAVRLAHLGVLHWRVWSQLAYNVDTEFTGTD